MLQDASARADDDAPPTPPAVAPVPRGMGRKFHHLRSRMMVTSDRDAAALAKSFSRLVQMIVNEGKFQIPSARRAIMDKDDLFSIGMTMMIQAHETYDPSRGAKLSTWIAFRVRQGLMNVVSELHANGGRGARGEAQAFDRGSVEHRPYWISLDQSVRGGSGETSSDRSVSVGDTLASEDPIADEELEEASERMWLQDAIVRCIEGRERLIVLDFLDGMTGEEVADRHGMTRQRAHQIYDAATERLRKCRECDDRAGRRAASRAARMSG